MALVYLADDVFYVSISWDWVLSAVVFRYIWLVRLSLSLSRLNFKTLCSRFLPIPRFVGLARGCVADKTVHRWVTDKLEKWTD